MYRSGGAVHHGGQGGSPWGVLCVSFNEMVRPSDILYILTIIFNQILFDAQFKGYIALLPYLTISVFMGVKWLLLPRSINRTLLCFYLIQSGTNPLAVFGCSMRELITSIPIPFVNIFSDRFRSDSFVSDPSCGLDSVKMLRVRFRWCLLSTVISFVSISTGICLMRAFSLSSLLSSQVTAHVGPAYCNASRAVVNCPAYVPDNSSSCNPPKLELSNLALIILIYHLLFIFWACIVLSVWVNRTCVERVS